MASCLKEWEDGKDGAQEVSLLVGRRKKELAESVLSLKVRDEKPLVAKRSLDADSVALGVERESFNESLATRDV